MVVALSAQIVETGAKASKMSNLECKPCMEEQTTVSQKRRNTEHCRELTESGVRNGAEQVMHGHGFV